MERLEIWGFVAMSEDWNGWMGVYLIEEYGFGKEGLRNCQMIG